MAFVSAFLPFIQEENANSTSVKKQQLNATKKRKPFADRSVNQNGQEFSNKKIEDVKPESISKKTVCEENVTSEDDLFMDTFSYKEVSDTYVDIFPKPHRFTKVDIENMKNFYIGRSETPPPVHIEYELELEPIFLTTVRDDYFVNDVVELPTLNFM